MLHVCRLEGSQENEKLVPWSYPDAAAAGAAAAAATSGAGVCTYYVIIGGAQSAP